MPFIDPAWKNQADPVILEYERNFVAGDLIVGIGYGIQILLYGSCMHDLYGRTRRPSSADGSKRNLILLMMYITLLFSIETIFVAVQANTVQIMYVDYRNYPGGPWEFFLHTQHWAVNVMFYATLFVLTFLSDLLVLWRCWVIWNASGKFVAYLVTAFPAAALLGSFVVGTFWTLQSSQPGLSFYSKVPMAFGTSYYAISLGLNIILTILIIVRLLMYRRQITATLPKEHASHYTSMATIIVESAAVYSLCALLFLITYAANNPANQSLLGIASAAQQVASYLIIFRLASGRAWQKNTLKQTLSAMNFNSAPERKTGGSATITHLGTFQASPRSMAEEESTDISEKDRSTDVAGSDDKERKD